jgi:hypothetical protein
VTEPSPQEKNLRPTQFRALCVLIATGDDAGAAHAASVSLRTLRRWKALPAWEAEARRVETETAATAARMLGSLANEAIGVLGDILRDSRAKPYVKQRAAETILENALRWRESVAFEQRLARLEATLCDSEVG